MNMAKPVLTTSKMSKETEQQYSAWLLYCEIGSIGKLMQLWDGVGQRLDESWTVFAQKLGAKPSHTTIGKWSKKFRWVERTDLKLAEDIQALRDKTKKIATNKKHKIAEALDRISNKIIKRLRSNEEPTIDEWKKVWEMFRTEMGESLGKHELDIREEDQKPPTEEEMAGIGDISQAFKAFYEQQWKRPGKETGHLLGNKKQDKK